MNINTSPTQDLLNCINRNIALERIATVATWGPNVFYLTNLQPFCVVKPHTLF